MEFEWKISRLKTDMAFYIAWGPQTELLYWNMFQPRCGTPGGWLVRELVLCHLSIILQVFMG